MCKLSDEKKGKILGCASCLIAGIALLGLISLSFA